MRVCYVIGTYPLVTTTFVDREIRGLQRLRVDVQVVAVRRPAASAPLSEEQRELQRDVQYLLPIVWRSLLASHLFFALRRPRTYVATLARLVTRPHAGFRARCKTMLHFGEGVYAAGLVRRRRFDELHAHFADRAATIALVAARLLDVPYSLSVHAGADIYVDPVLLPEKVRAARQVLTCTAHNKSHLASTVGRDVTAKVTVVPHGLDLDRYRPQRDDGAGRPTILAVGQLTQRKGFAQLVAACEQLHDEGLDFACRIVGDGAEREGLRALVGASGVADVVELCGARSPDEVVDEYHRATLFVLPCVEASNGDVDGIPNVLLEAMACGLPVVSSDLPAIRELITSGTNGVLLPPGDVTALAGALRQLIEDPASRAELGNAGRRTVVDMFDGDMNARRVAEVLWPEHVAEVAGVAGATAGATARPGS
jgi:glycosyltransferase involved in cell wall biosynthesis